MNPARVLFVFLSFSSGSSSSSAVLVPFDWNGMMFF